MPGISVLANGSPFMVIPATGFSGRFHQRATVTIAAAELKTFLTPASYPVITGPDGAPICPSMLCIGVETVDSANPVYITMDGGSSPEVSATNGFVVPVLPNWLQIPQSQLFCINTTSQCRVVAVGGTAHCQLFWQF